LVMHIKLLDGTSKLIDIEQYTINL
jgi:hypothetical protein